MRDPIRIQIQANGRVRRWGFFEETGKYLRVITEPDGETVHNAFFDRHFSLSRLELRALPIADLLLRERVPAAA